MEDCLVAVQRGNLSLSADGIDLLLAGTDWLSQFGQSAGEQFAAWFTPREAEVNHLVEQLESVLRGEQASPVSAPTEAAHRRRARFSPRPSRPASLGRSRRPIRSILARSHCFKTKPALVKPPWARLCKHGKRL